MVVTEFDDIGRCQNKCGKSCHDIDVEQQKHLRNKYWEIEKPEEKTLYLFQFVTKEETARITTKSKSRRANTFQYYLQDKQMKLHPVCQDMFLKTYGITAKRLRVVREKKFSDLPYNVAYKHQNATKPPNNKLPQEVDDAIENHIKRFPTVPSHYCRKDSDKLYFEKGLTKRKMCTLYNSQEGISIGRA